MRKLLLKKENFYFITVLIIVAVLGLAFGPFYKLHEKFWSHSILTILIFVFAISHGIINKGTKNTLTFLALSFAISFAAEFIGINFSYSFGGYSYSDLLGPKILGVPFLVILMWAALIYVAYALSEHILDFRITKHISKKDKFYLAFFSSIVAALAAVAWDFVLDPLAVTTNWWTWQTAGVYFGIPASNFIGWFIVVFLAVFLFKMLFEKEHEETETKYDYAPALCYFLLYLSIIGLSLETGQPIFILIGFVTMFPFISIILVRYFTMKTKVPHLFKHKPDGKAK